MWKLPRSTVRMAPTAAREVADIDFGKLGTFVDPISGKRQLCTACLLCW
jgi:hypothetical protein